MTKDNECHSFQASRLDLLARVKLGIRQELLTRETIRRRQTDMLNETLMRAKKFSRFYRSHLPEESRLILNNPDNLAGIPFTEPEHIKDNLNEFLCVSPHEIERIVTLSTSGSAGAPKRIGFTRNDLESTTDFFEYGMQELVSDGERVMICFPGSTENCMVELLAKGISKFGGKPLVYGAVSDVTDAAEFILAHDPQCIVGIPVQIFGLASYFSARFSGKGNIKTVLLSSDNMAETLRRRIEYIFDCKVYNHYGTTEMGYGAAMECQARDGMHLREVDIYFEIVDPQTGEALPAGSFGEVVITTLGRAGMPLIRYKTGDFASFIDRKCPCGSVLRRMTPPCRKNECEIFLDDCVLNLKEMDESMFAIDGLIDYEVFVGKGIGEATSLKLILWRGCGQKDDPAMCDTVIQKVGSLLPENENIRISAEIADADYPPPCLRGKRLFRIKI